MDLFSIRDCFVTTAMRYWRTWRRAITCQTTRDTRGSGESIFRLCVAVCGTALGYGATLCGTEGTELGHSTTPYGTELGDGAIPFSTEQGCTPALCGTGLGYSATTYGTEVGYGATVGGCSG
eukprot:3561863-Rhodomonas_salina.1